MPRPQILRQIFMLSGLFLCNISDGYIFGQMSGMLAAFHSNNSEILITKNQLSWMASIINITCVCGFGIAGVVTDKFGRRWSVIVLTLPVLASWLMLYFAEEVVLFLLSRAVVGISYGGVTLMTAIITTECTSPNIRCLFLYLIISVAPALGTTIGHILGILLHWRTVALLGVIPSALSAIIPLFWYESPSWLASKGRFEECEVSFRAIRGLNDATEKELKQLIEVEKQKLKKISKKNVANLFLHYMTKKYFWKLLLLSYVVSLYRVGAGKVLFNTYAVTMLQEITGSSDILLFMFLVDGLAVLGTCMSCILIKNMNVRTLLFSTGMVANILLIILSACLYSSPKNDNTFPWINSTLLGLYFVTINAGLYPILETLLAEIFPLEIKSYCIFLLGVACGVAFFLSIKFAPSMFSSMGYHGVFLLNVGIMTLCISYLWKYLPETKGKSLHDIELYFKNDGKKNETLEVEEQLKMLS